MTTGTALPPAPPEFGAVFSRSWEVFKRNWIVSLPPVIAGVVIGGAVIIYTVLLVVMAGVGFWSAAAGGRHHATPPVAGYVAIAVLGALAIFAFALIAGLWSNAAMYGMADAAWRRGTTNFGDGFTAFRMRGGAVFVAWIAIFLLAIAAVVLALPTLFISVIALSFVTMYVFPAVVAGGRGGFEAVGESFRLIRRFFGPSIITWLVLYAIQYGISFLMMGAVLPLEFSALPTGSDDVPHVPPIPMLMFSGVAYVASIVLLLGYTGFLALVQVAMYEELRAQPEPVPAYLPPPSQRPPIPPALP